MATVEIEGIPLRNVHEEIECMGRTCIIHSPTDHHMRSWPLHWRDDRKIFERICEHGIGHPDPDQFDYWDSIGGIEEGVHGCDSCCVPAPYEVRVQNGDDMNSYIHGYLDAWEASGLPKPRGGFQFVSQTVVRR